MSVEPVIAEPVAPAATPAASAPVEPVLTPAVETPLAPAAPAEPSWRDSLSVDHRADPSLADFKNVDDLAKSYIHQGKLIGGDKIPKPQEDWTPEQYEEHWGRLGRPGKAEDYDLSEVVIPEGLPMQDGFQDSMVAKLHARGLSQTQLSGALGDYYELVGGQHQAAELAIAQETESDVAALKVEWGKSFDAQVDLARRAISAGAGERNEAVQELKMADGRRLGDHPDVIRIFAALGGKMSEHGLVGKSSLRTIMSPAEAGAEKNKLIADPEFFKAWSQAGHLGHKDAVKRITKLMQAQHPEV